MSVCSPSAMAFSMAPTSVCDFVRSGEKKVRSCHGCWTYVHMRDKQHAFAPLPESETEGVSHRNNGSHVSRRVILSLSVYTLTRPAFP